MSLGPLMIGVEGVELTSQERELLRHPLVGGVILFARNCESPWQVRALNEEIHALRKPRLLIAVDQEGGRVQRFKDGFTRLPAVRALGQVFDDDPRRALRLAQLTGWLMAVELRAVGVDFSFAPVLDLDWGISGVIGDRAFHRSPEIVSRLARAYIRGMRRGGMAATGKHFPGHGAVAEDSHFALPIDERSLDEIIDQDLVPFASLCRDGLAAVMPAHVIYAQVDSQPAGFSSIWIRDILRGRLGFQGLVFSDDLDMQGAAGAGGPEQRVRAALEAGCDMALVCNDRSAAHRVLDRLDGFNDPLAHLRLVRMHGRGTLRRERLQRSGKWARAVDLVQSYDCNPLLDLDPE